MPKIQTIFVFLLIINFILYFFFVKFTKKKKTCGSGSRFMALQEIPETIIVTHFGSVFWWALRQTLYVLLLFLLFFGSQLFLPQIFFPCCKTWLICTMECKALYKYGHRHPPVACGIMSTLKHYYKHTYEHVYSLLNYVFFLLFS